MTIFQRYLTNESISHGVLARVMQEVHTIMLSSTVALSMAKHLNMCIYIYEFIMLVHVSFAMREIKISIVTQIELYLPENVAINPTNTTAHAFHKLTNE